MSAPKHAAGFADLDFRPRRKGRMGVQATMFWPNGYGVSVIQGPYSYGGPEGLWELAVLAGDESSHALSYDTPVTSDVEGRLSKAAVTRLMRKVQALPAKATREAAS